MANITEIIVAIEAEGVDKVLTALKQVDGAQTQVVNSSKAAGSQQIGVNTSIKQSWSQLTTGINQGTEIVRTALQIGASVTTLVTDWADYADGMRLGAQMTGVTTEEMSRLVQAADDYRVPVDKMQQSMELALKNGFVPTIANVAALSDKLLAIKDPAERAALAAGIFGKSYADVMPFLMAGSAAIKGTTAAIADNLVVTKAQAEAAKDTKDAIDDFDDSWTGAKNNLGEALTPVAVDSLKTLTHALTGVDIAKKFIPLNAELKDLGLNVGKLTDPYKGFMGILSGIDEALVTQMATAKDWAQTTTKSFIDSGDSAEIAQAKTADLFNTYGMAATATQATQDWADANDRVFTGLASISDEEANAAVFAAELAAAEIVSVANVELMRAGYSAIAGDWKSMAKMAISYDEILTAIGDNNGDMEQLRSIVAGTATEFNGVAMSVEEAELALVGLGETGKSLDAAMAQIASSMTLSMMQASMEVGGYTESEIDALTQYMVDAGMISAAAAEQMKTDYIAAMKLANALELDAKIGEILADTTQYENGLAIVNGKLVDAKTGKVLADISDFLAGMSEAELAKLDPKIVAILAELGPYLREILGIPDPPDKVVDITTNYIDGGFTPNVPNSVDVWVNYIEGGRTRYAVGGPIYPGQAATWNEPGREGELLLPEKYGRVLSNHEVAQVMREALSGGGGESKSGNQPTNVTNNYFTLTMPTSNNPADVKTAFELMEAWSS